MNTIAVLRPALLAGVSLAMLAAAPALAQETESSTGPAPEQQAPAPVPPNAANTAAESGVQDIVVTAQFRSQKLQDTPLSITAVNSGLLEARSQTNIAQVANQAPNVVLIPGGGAFGPSIGASIRGVGQFDFNPAYEPGVGLYIDDVYYATLTGGVFDLLDLDRVEILRGPQGTLTGRNSEGGAIKLFSKKPDGNEGGYLEGSYGNRDYISLRGGADFKLTDTLFGRIAGSFKQRDGYVRQVDYGCANPGNALGIASTQSTGHCTVAKLGETSQEAIRGQLRWNPSDRFDVTVSADYSNESRTNSPEVLTFLNTAVAGNTPDLVCGKYCTYADFKGPDGKTFPNRTTFKGGGASINGTYNLTDDLSLTSITAYRKYRATFGTDDDFSVNPLLEAGGYNNLSHHFFSEEARLNGKVLDGLAEFTVGGYLSTQKTTYYTFQDIGYIVPGVPLTFVGDDPVKAKSQAVFGTVIVHPTDALTLTGGLRYTHESKDYTFHRADPATGGPVTGLAAAFGLGALDGLTSKYRGSRVDYRASVDYRFAPQVLAYATFSTGFKGGGVSARPFTAQQALQGTFNPETLTNYEIGLKNDLFDRKLRVNLSAFINDYKDIQTPLADCTAYGGGPCGVVANAGNARFKGVEMEVDARPIEGLSIDGSVSYLKSKFKSISPAVGTNVFLTDPATTAPKFKWSVGAQYAIDLGGSGSLTPRVDASYNGKMYEGRAIGGNQYFLPSYTLANARLTWRNENKDLSISGEVTNLFDKYYYNAIFSAVYSFSGTAYEQIGRPREYGITVNKRF